jgi:hypothetical protein
MKSWLSACCMVNLFFKSAYSCADTNDVQTQRYCPCLYPGPHHMNDPFCPFCLFFDAPSYPGRASLPLSAVALAQSCVRRYANDTVTHWHHEMTQ